MAATQLPPENERELAVLRARAYGPNAARLDAQDLERLTALEDIARLSRQEVPPGVAEGPVSKDPGIVALGSGAESPAATLSWWRRIPLAAFVAAAAVMGLMTGLAGPGLVPPHPDFVLSAVPHEGDRPHFGSYGELADPPTRYEEFHDVEVWSLRTAAGTVCLVVRPPDRSWLAEGCAPRPLDPIADLYAYRVIREIEGIDLADGSLVRFVLDDGAVQVWIDESVG